MKRALLYIGIVFSAVSCHEKGFRPETGDLLFQLNEPSAMTDAITASTGENFSHVAIAVRYDGADSVIEATGKCGVRMASLCEFLASSAQIGGKPGVVVMRLRDTTGIAGHAVQNARRFLGQPYDYSYLPGNGKLYCSELVWESYRTPEGGPIFTAHPMNFRDSAGTLPAFWLELFEKLGEPVPEGILGTNPNDLSQECILEEVHRYF